MNGSALIVRRTPGHGSLSSDRLNRPLGIEETFPHRLARIATIWVSLAVLCALAWAAVAKVNEVSHATGVLAPTAFEQQVQHFEGGRIAAILVKQGDIVSKDQAILKLADSGTPEDVAVAVAMRADIRAQIEALEAVRDGRTPQFDDDASASAAGAASAATLLARRQSLSASRLQIGSQVAQARAAIAALQQEANGTRMQLALAQRESDRYQDLFDRGLTTVTVVTQRQRSALELSNRLAVLREQESGARARLAESQRSLGTFEAQSTLDLSEQVRALQARLVEVEGDLTKKSNRGDRLVVRAPVAGVIKELNAESVGAVITPAQTIAKIVPVDGPLYADTRVPASQVAYLRAGQVAKVKISAFDFTRYGWVEGNVASISPSSFADDAGNRFYGVRVAINDRTLPQRRGATLLPGMEVTADIITGRKTVLDYLLSPVRRGFDTAFTER